jgi:hypothetical protein
LIGLFPPSTGGWLLGVIASVYVYQLEIINNLTLHGKKEKNKQGHMCPADVLVITPCQQPRGTMMEG